MTSPKQKAANRLNAIKSTGPRSTEGIRSASLNAVKHRLSLPVSEQFFGEKIAAVTALVRAECVSDHQAKELAKRIIDFERNEQFLRDFNTDEAEAELKAWMYCATRFELIQLAKAHENKQKAWITFTTSNKKPKGKARIEEMKFIEGFMRIQDKTLVGNIKREKNKQSAVIRYQKRATNQLVKAVHHLAKGEEF
jgi:hypothetical protein